ncbi:hypothetical protein TNCV_3989281 [Trichonephila clavipes]|nr:hypothetical protein TNCV_3989281 [Trichonephila clavipes]
MERGRRRDSAFTQKDGRDRKTMKENGTNPETFPGRTGREDVPRNSKRSNEAERRRGEGKNAGRQSGRLKAVNQSSD